VTSVITVTAAINRRAFCKSNVEGHTEERTRLGTAVHGAAAAFLALAVATSYLSCVLLVLLVVAQVLVLVGLKVVEIASSKAQDAFGEGLQVR